jgi:hypothetical protein
VRRALASVDLRPLRSWPQERRLTEEERGILHKKLRADMLRLRENYTLPVERWRF